MRYLVFLYLMIGICFAAYADKVMAREEVKKDLEFEPPLWMYFVLIFVWPLVFVGKVKFRVK